MPCFDGGWGDTPSETSQKEEIAMLTAAMCGVLTVIEGRDGNIAQLLDDVDWAEAGVKRKDLEQWWKDHKKQDELRRQREEAERVKKELRESAIKKLTAAERAILGIKL